MEEINTGLRAAVLTALIIIQLWNAFRKDTFDFLDRLLYGVSSGFFYYYGLKTLFPGL